MIKKLINKIWKKTPGRLRLKIIRLVQKKFTASTAAVVINERREVLLLDHALRVYSNWGLPGGFIEKGEQAGEAIKRELYEETGLKLEDVKLLRVRTIGQHIEILFTAGAKGNARVKSREINGFGWFAIDEMPEGMSREQKKIISEALSGEI